MRKLILLAAPLALGACATLSGGDRPGRELVGETLRLQTAGGQTSTLTFQRDGIVTARFGERAIAGRWRIEGPELCFYWAGAPRECWPYELPFREGETRTLTSTRGNRVVVTHIS